MTTAPEDATARISRLEQAYSFPPQVLLGRETPTSFPVNDGSTIVHPNDTIWWDYCDQNWQNAWDPGNPALVCIPKGQNICGIEVQAQVHCTQPISQQGIPVSYAKFTPAILLWDGVSQQLEARFGIPHANVAPGTYSPCVAFDSGLVKINPDARPGVLYVGLYLVQTNTASLPAPVGVGGATTWLKVKFIQDLTAPLG